MSQRWMVGPESQQQAGDVLGMDGAEALLEALI